MTSSTFRALALGLAAMAVAVPARGEPAVATIKLVDGSDAGTATLTQSSAGVLLKLELKGLKPGAHAIHVHETGKCEGDFATAGGIFNPLGAEHGLLNENGPMAGDLPNVYAAPDGTVVAELLSPFLTLSKDIEDKLLDDDGASIVVFDGPDDHLISPDDAGTPRVACGVIAPK